MKDIIDLVSDGALVASAVFAIFMTVENFLTDFLHPAYLAFITFLINGIVSFFRLSSEEAGDDQIQYIMRRTTTVAQSVGLGLFTSELMIENKFHELGNLAPMAFGIAILAWYLVDGKDKKQILTSWVYVNAIAMMAIGGISFNVFSIAGGLVLAVGQFAFLEGKEVMEIPAYVQFNYFLALFTIFTGFSMHKTP